MACTVNEKIEMTDLKVSNFKKIHSAVSSVCQFCHQPGCREEELGKLHSLNGVSVHYYCILFSCALEQKGQDDEGILGFLPNDIEKELRRGSKLKCCYCSLPGATIGCSKKNCRKTYHFPCGLDKASQFIFCDDFSSYCVSHRTFQKADNIGEFMECAICAENMKVDPKFSISPPCCQTGTWFHKLCLQKLALSAGYFFKCPLCNDKDIFIMEMQKLGIFIPERDASWELEPNAFQDLLERPMDCTASVCKSPLGRRSNDGRKWRLLLCELCGSSAIHSGCRNGRHKGDTWNCPSCLELLKVSNNQVQSRKTIKKITPKKRKLSTSPSMSLKKIKSEFLTQIEEPTPCSSTGFENNYVKKNHGNVSKLYKILHMERDYRIDQKAIVSELIAQHSILPESLRNIISFAETISTLKSICMEEINYLLKEKYALSFYLSENILSQFSSCSLRYDQMFYLYKLINLLHLYSPYRNRSGSVKTGFLNLMRGLYDLLNKNISFMNSLEDHFSVTKHTTNFEVTPGKANSSDDEAKDSEVVRKFTCKVRETCPYCLNQMLPGIYPTSINLKSLDYTILCLACHTEVTIKGAFTIKMREKFRIKREKYFSYYDDPRIFREVSPKSSNFFKECSSNLSEDSFSDIKPSTSFTKSPSVSPLKRSESSGVSIHNSFIETSTVSSCLPSASKDHSPNVQSRLVDEDNSMLRSLQEIKTEHCLTKTVISSVDSPICHLCKFDQVSQKRTIRFSGYACVACNGIPRLCSQKHFDIWHKITHNCLKIPVKCKGMPMICTVCFVDSIRFYCPACPGYFGFCSKTHFDIFHRENRALFGNIDNFMVEMKLLNIIDYLLPDVEEKETDLEDGGKPSITRASLSELIADLRCGKFVKEE